MTQTAKALLWATAMIALALATSAGLISREVAEPVFYAMPVLAVISLGQSRPCCVAKLGGRA